MWHRQAQELRKGEDPLGNQWKEEKSGPFASVLSLPPGPGYAASLDCPWALPGHHVRKGKHATPPPIHCHCFCPLHSASGRTDICPPGGQEPGSSFIHLDPAYRDLASGLSFTGSVPQYQPSRPPTWTLPEHSSNSSLWLFPPTTTVRVLSTMPPGQTLSC